MPVSNIRIIVAVIILSLFCASRTSIHEQVLLHSFRKVRQLSLHAPSEQNVIEGALEGIANKLQTDYGDRYAAYENNDEQKTSYDQLENTLVGIGVFPDFDPKTRETILYPLPHSPALQAGVKHGDILVKVDGKDIGGLSRDELSQKLRGPEGTKVTLTVRRREQPSNGENATLDLPVTRKMQMIPTVTGDRLKHDGTWDYTLETHPNIGYIALSSTFSHQTAVEVAKALEELNRHDQVKALIIDLRGNPGGYLDAAVDMCNLFLEKGNVIVTTQGRSSQQTVYAEGNRIWHKPVIVLIDHGSASASEIVSACLQDHKIATIVGTRSYGKGTVQEMFDLPLKMGTFRLTKAEYVRPSGKNINRHEGDSPEKVWGVSPDPGCEAGLSKKQVALLSRLRRLRAIVPENELPENTEALVSRLRINGESADNESETDVSEAGESNTDIVDDADTQKAGVKETDPKKNVVDAPSQPEGTSPYYDPQLDRAIQCIEH
ncbi:MAG: S41 family peptidase [Planctomycetaceae bacterium]|nr:S41 family peptidase [Planctomycetaceae bacterium]